MIAENDIKRWAIGFEEGKNGYKHYQVRIETGNDRFFSWCKQHIPTAHIEKSNKWCDYERKDGNFIQFNDTNDIRQVRFGKPNDFQNDVLRTLKSQSVRQVDVWYDPGGNHGKTWISLHLWERGTALVIPRSALGAQRVEGFILDAYQKHWYDIIIIDIPRSGKIPTDIYETIEEIKDGLVSDWRYGARQCDIRGVKVAVFTNKLLDTKKLSRDRWRLHGISESPLS